MEEEDVKIETTEKIVVQAKERTTSVSCEASSLCETEKNQSKESEPSLTTSNAQTFDSSKSAKCSELLCRTGIKITESDILHGKLNTETDVTGSGKAEVHERPLVVMSTSIQPSDKASTLGTQDGGEKISNENGSLNSSGDKPIEIDCSKTRDAMPKGKQSFKETFESGCSTNLDQEKEDNTKDSDKPQENVVTKASCNEKRKNKDIGNGSQISARELDSNEDGSGSKPKKPRKRAAKKTDDENSSAAVSQEMCTEDGPEDVDAQWSLHEKRLLLDALDSDAGRGRWNAIANHVKTKNIHQVKHFTEKLRAQANGQSPAHLVGDKDDPLQAWINICERLRAGQEDIDAKCIPQVMTIAAVEPTSATQENTNCPNYSRIYTFLSSILRGQASVVGLTPVDARVVLELIQSLEMKIMNADLLEQQTFLRNKYTSLAKDLEKEQIVLAMDELQKEIGDKDTRELNSCEEKERSGTSDGQLCKTEAEAYTKGDERFKGLYTLASLCSNCNVDEIGGEEAKAPMDIQIEKSSETSEPLPSHTASVVDLEDEGNISNSDEITEKAMTPMKIQTDKRSDTAEFVLSSTATAADLRQANDKKKHTSLNIEAEEGTLPSSTVMAPESEQANMDETNTITNSKTSDTPTSNSSISFLQNTTFTPVSKRRSKKIPILEPPEESLTKSKIESRKLKIKRLKRSLKRPKLSSLNPVCVPVTMLNMKPKVHQL